MGKIWTSGGSGGADTSIVTATSADVEKGKVIVDANGNPLTGVLELTGNAIESQVLSGKTFYNTALKTKKTGTMTNRGNTNATLPINGSYAIPSGYHAGGGKVTQSIATQGAITYTPKTYNQTLAAGRYLSGNVTVLGDADLVASKIKKGVNIFGVTGTWEGYVRESNAFYKYGNYMTNVIAGSGGTNLQNGIWFKDQYNSKAGIRSNSNFNFSSYSTITIDYHMLRSTATVGSFIVILGTYSDDDAYYEGYRAPATVGRKTATIPIPTAMKKSTTFSILINPNDHTTEIFIYRVWVS